MTIDNVEQTSRIDASSTFPKRVRVGPGSNRRPGKSASLDKPSPSERGRPDICVVRNGDRIESIKVICSCGEEININCIYPESK
ncbi:MAG: hypothetical protein AAF456_09730 [Planctomycetota bacterium]